MEVQLQRIANRFASRAMTCETAFRESRDTHAKAYYTIRLYAEWELFGESLVTACALSRCIRAQGTLIAPPSNIKSRADFETVLRRVCNRSPRAGLNVAWGVPSLMNRICAGLNLVNASTIQAAIQSQDSPADELRRVRNFLAHRNSDTASQLSLSPPVANLSVATLVAWLETPGLGLPSPLRTWAVELIDVALAAVM